ncbi:MAG: helix-turn-helix domain-containing protein, partial [Thermoplasmatota archaeon]
LVENFGPKIRQARERKKLTKEFLGGKVAARVPQLNQIESGHLRPSDQLARALERELGITLLEKVDETQAHQTKKVGGAGLTIGDLIKDERKK